MHQTTCLTAKKIFTGEHKVVIRKYQKTAHQTTCLTAKQNR
jgi:hypothetical protein